MNIYPLYFLVFLLFFPAISQAEEAPLSIDKETLPVIYSGQESMHFSISWSGGIKIGDLYMSVKPEESGDGLVITARVTDYGLFKLFYPVDDIFTTYVRGEQKLPYRYEVHQKEGSGMDVHRLTLYDQQNHTVVYRKNKNPENVYSVAGIVYNEYSSFYINRVLHLDPEHQEIVPAFVDKKRHLVAVKVFGTEPLKTIFGTRDTIKVMPIMNFKGLYDKDGDTVFWLTSDICRIPVLIKSKIAIGSLVAELVEYSNPVCKTIR